MRCVTAAVALACLGRASADPHAVAYSLVAAGSACANADHEVSPNAGSAQQCAELVCADPACGALFEDRSHQGGRCSCLAAGQACAEVADPDANRYEVTDTSTCEPKGSHDCFAMVYENPDFTGWSGSFPEGFHSADDFANFGAFDNGVSSVYVSGEGCETTLFGNSDFTGWSLTIPEGSHSLADLESQGFKDDDVSSIAVHFGTLQEPKPPAPPAPAEAMEARPRATTLAAPSMEVRAPAPGPGPAPGPPGWGSAMWERLSGHHHEAEPQRRAPPRKPQHKPMVMPGAALTAGPPWAAQVPAHVWHDIPSWVRSNMSDASCDPLTRERCDEQEAKFIADVRKELCKDGDCSLPHAHDLLSEAKRIVMKRQVFRDDRRTWVEKRSTILFTIYARLGHPSRQDL